MNHNPQQTSVLRIATAGSVDDGKSTLIGRLLYESNAILDDQLEALQKQKRIGAALDLSLVTDGLKSEREQGITIDVAYKYFSTPRRKFILADAPGHVQYTRNMVTAASRADAAIILIDARYGVQEQTRRHAYLVHLLGVQHVIVAINKIDLIDYDSKRIAKIESDFRALEWNDKHRALHVIPLSALVGDNISEKSAATPWYQGAPLLSLLESLPVQKEIDKSPRLAVQLIVRDRQGRRYATGTLAQGSLKVGEAVRILPSNQLSVIADLLVAGQPARQASHGEAIAVALRDERDLERGSLIVSADHHALATQSFTAKLVWFDDEAYRPEERYILRIGTQSSRASVAHLNYRFDLEALAPVPTGEVKMNDIVQVEMHSSRPLYLDRFVTNKLSGSFILIDPRSFRTVAAGLVDEVLNYEAKTHGGIQIVESLAEGAPGESQSLAVPKEFLTANALRTQQKLFEGLLEQGWIVRLEQSPEAEWIVKSLRSLGYGSYESGSGI